MANTGAPTSTPIYLSTHVHSGGGSGGSGGTVAYDSGWVNQSPVDSTSVAANTDLNFAHGLGTVDVVWQIYAADDSSGTNSVAIDIQLDQLSSANDTWGAAIIDVTTTTFKLSLGTKYIHTAYNTGSGKSWAYVKVVGIASSGSSRGPAAYDSGWFNNTNGLANGGTYSFTHGLGTENFVAAIWVADDSSGTNRQVIFTDSGASSQGSKVDGAVVSDASSTTLEVQLGANGGFSVSSTGNWSGFNWSTKYFKVVAVASGTSSGPRAFVAFDGTSSNLTGSITNSLNVASITDQGTGKYDIAWTNTVADPVFTVAAENHNNQLGLAGVINITSSGVRLVGHSITSGLSDPPYISIVAH